MPAFEHTTEDGAYCYFTPRHAIDYATSAGFIVAQSDPDKLNGWVVVNAQRYDVAGGYELEKVTDTRYVWRRYEEG